MSEVLYARPSVRIRLATEADNAALCDVVRRVHLRSALDVTQERDPDFFTLPRLHQGEFDVFVAENAEGFVGGCGSVIVRDGWVDGEVRKVGYLSDLRAVPGFRGARALPAAYRAALERARDVHGAEVFYTVIFDDNAVAKKALLRADARRGGQPRYRVMTPFQMTAVQFTLPCPRPKGRVGRAGPADRDDLVAFLAARSRDRVMGEVLTPERFEARLALWPGLDLDSFFVARDARGEIVGAVAPWDSHALKRTRVLGYHGPMRTLKRAFAVGSTLLRFPPLPEPGDCFRFFWLSHLEVTDDDPAVLRDLLRAVYRALRPARAHFLSAMIPVGSPLERAFGGFVVNRTPMTVYSVTLEDSPWADRSFETRRPRFEMALS